VPIWTDPQIPVLGPRVPRAHGPFAAAVGRLMMGLRGWRIEGTIPDVPKAVLVVAPHTSNWDFLTGLWVKLGLRFGVRFVGKHTLFRGPVGIFRRWLGGVPVNRSAALGFVREASRAVREAERMILVIAPEGTRKPAPWKSGFYRIAIDAGVPILLAGFDYSRRVVWFGPQLEPTGDYEKDLAFIRSHYDARMARVPRNFFEKGGAAPHPP
jgi:1-acyl-sn-glycerol-3-phosphate acyltransferase